MVEVVVYRPEDVALVAARVARAGAHPLLEDPAIPLARLGIERLDRIPCHSVGDADDEQCGMKRGKEDWDFSWVPDGWTPPLTWDALVANVADEDPLALLAQPLRSHVARWRLARGAHAALGTRWLPCAPPTERELALQEEAHPFAMRRVLRGCEALEAHLATWTELDEADLAALVPPDLTPQTIVRATDGQWYRPEDPRRALEAHLRPGGGRWVSATLSSAQSRQLLEAFYLLRVERVEDPTLVRALRLLLFHYLRGRGYMARWVGKYVQEARFVGNGDRFRAFRRLTQYAPHKLPAPVLSRMCLRDGRRVTRGSKGSRSKYAARAERYVPVKRIRRTEEDEEFMLATER